MLRVFLSSTFSDLVAERTAVQAGIHRMAARFIGMEHFGSFSAGPLEQCLREVRSAHVLVLVLGDRYGYVPNSSPISMTEAEYREARKNNIPVLSYLQHPGTSPFEKGPDPRLVRFREELASGHGVSSFSSPDDLAWKVASDLAREFSHLLGNNTQSVEDVRNQILIDPIQGRLDELIGILEHRAEKIRTELQDKHTYVPVEKYLCKFDELHRKHIGSLRAGKIMQAHELLSEIHSISYQLTKDEFWARHHVETPDVNYCLADDAFERGPLVSCYIVGEMASHSNSYSSDEGYTRSWRKNTISPTVAVALYQRILGECQDSSRRTTL